MIATHCASAPEVIDDGITGFLCDDEEEMIEAVSRLNSIDRNNCRKAAEERFSTERMLSSYLQVAMALTTPPGQI